MSKTIPQTIENIFDFINPLKRKLGEDNSDINYNINNNSSHLNSTSQSTLRKKRNKYNYNNNQDNTLIKTQSYLEPKKIIKGLYSYGVDTLYSISNLIGLTRSSNNTNNTNNKRELLKTKIQSRLTKPKHNLKYLRIDHINQPKYITSINIRPIDSEQTQVPQEINIYTNINMNIHNNSNNIVNEPEVIDLCDSEEDSTNNNNNSNNTSINNSNSNNNGYYTPTSKKISNINTIRVETDKDKNKGSIENLIKSYQKSLSLSVSYNSNIESSQSIGEKPFDKILGTVKNGSVNRDNRSTYSNELRMSDLEYSKSPFSPIKYSSLSKIPTSYNNTGFESSNNTSSPTHRSLSQSNNNLISSLRPKFIELTIDKKEPIDDFKAQFEFTKQSFRDNETKDLLEKLDKLHQANKYHILQQLSQRIEKERNQKPIVRPPTQQEDEVIRDALNGDSDSLINKLNNLPVLRSDLRTLQHGKWLNDEVINFYFELFKERQIQLPERYPKCHFFNTFFYQMLCNNNGTYNYDRVKKWTNTVDIFSMDKIIIPIHLGNHWCLSVINFKLKQIEYYDSLLGDNRECTNKLKRYLQDEMNLRKKNGIINLDEWKTLFPKEIPCQNNGYDCGVFMCKFADYSARGVSFTFTQKDITIYRKMMILEIVNKKIF